MASAAMRRALGMVGMVLGKLHKQAWIRKEGGELRGDCGTPMFGGFTSDKQAVFGCRVWRDSVRDRERERGRGVGVTAGVGAVGKA